MLCEDLVYLTMYDTAVMEQSSSFSISTIDLSVNSII